MAPLSHLDSPLYTAPLSGLMKSSIRLIASILPNENDYRITVAEPLKDPGLVKRGSWSFSEPTQLKSTR